MIVFAVKEVEFQRAIKIIAVLLMGYESTIIT